MADIVRRNGNGLIPIAPASAANGARGLGYENASLTPMPQACQTCAKRKVKCDKVAPICSRCRKGGFECIYQTTTQPRSRKRKVSDEALEKLARYERILQENGLLDAETPAPTGHTPSEATRPAHPSHQPGTSKTGKLLTGRGKSRYVDSHTWYTLPDDEIHNISDEDEEDEGTPMSRIPTSYSDPLTGTLLGGPGHQILTQYHPTRANAMVMWKRYVDNVEPICKVLHIPSTTQVVDLASQHPETASKTEECLLFAIYYVAVYSMSEEDCANYLKQKRSAIMQQYHHAARQALVNASFLRTTEFSVLQAFFLFLLPARHSYDPHTYWILTGIASRIGQRIGLHQDGDKLGLPPFEVEMRRRLFCQVFPLDFRAGQSVGTEFMGLPISWDTQPPLNINDDQIWPGMIKPPTEQKGATDMIFCLSRAYLGKNLSRAGNPINGAAPWGFSDYHEAERLISAAENEVEEKFVRYCDVIDPLHFLTIGLARSGLTAMRLRARLPQVRDPSATDEERKEAFHLAQKTLGIDAAVHAHGGISRFQWHIRPFFLWGTREAFIFILTVLSKSRDLITLQETETAWNSVAELYKNHEELFDGREALYVGLRRLTLKAWDSSQSDNVAAEPAFIRTLRHLQDRKGARHNQFQSETAETPSMESDIMGFTMSTDFEFDVDDWVSWDKIIQNHQSQG
ncbi:hypothetical protein N7481_010069 [Penicillium waksmanii]|uniref:uncharacterized protein n=1 Tax=Penicillium waksmanii TaxID=69791 RepID=UPI002546FF70|nr:uncharacterized protein N7481_010069 [Penicillium waksmanii]KAJ5976362.1 hypothetical protein N7481_010069 [Penicillium waksmanii]